MEEVTRAIGLGVPVLLGRLLAPQVPDNVVLDRLVQDFKRRYTANPVAFSKPYPHVAEVLTGPLSGIRKVILSNKPDNLIQQILEHFSMSSLFDRVIGTGLDFPAKPDPAAIGSVMGEFGVARREAILIGDSSIDRETAGNAAIDFAWVDYGYEELARDAALRVFSSAEDWAELSMEQGSLT